MKLESIILIIAISAVLHLPETIFARSDNETAREQKTESLVRPHISEFGFVGPGFVGRPTRGAKEFEKRLTEKDPVKAFETWFEKGNNVEKAFSLVGLYHLDREAYLTKKNSIPNLDQKIPCTSGGCVVRLYTRTLSDLISDIENGNFHFRL